MARINIDTGELGNPATGDTLRTAMTKINTNFTEVYSLVRDGSSGLIATDVTNGDLKLQANGTGSIEIDTLSVQNSTITSITTNSDITLTPNGTGNVVLGNFTFNADQTVGAGQDNYVFTYDHSTGTIGLEATAADDVTASSTTTFTNKTFDANGTGNSISNIEVADFAGSAIINVSETLASNDSDTALVTAGAIIDYVDAQDANIASDSLTFTNKTFDVEGTGNSISNIDVADFKAAAIVTEAEGIGSNDNDTTLPTSAAVKDYVDARDIGDLSVVGSTISAPSNADLTLTTSGTGSVSIDGIQISGTELSSTDSTQITIKENLHVTGNITGTLTGSVAFSNVTSTPTTLAGYGITDAATLNNMAPTGAVDFTGATSIDFNTVTINNLEFADISAKPTTLSGYGITDAASATATALTVVGDDSTGTAVTLGETFKVAGATGITTAVSGDTLTITGPDLSNYLQNTGTQTIDNLTFNDNIIGTSSNADLELTPGGTGAVVLGDAIRIRDNHIEGTRSNEDVIIDPTGTGNVKILTDKITLGNQAGETSQGTKAIAVGYQAGKTTQGADAVAIGNDAGRNTQGDSAVAVGPEAGDYRQGASAVAIGDDAGKTSQSDNAVAIGNSAGEISQGDSATAVGFIAGYTGQGANATAVGNGAGEFDQGAGGVAIGNQAGYNGQGASAVAIGQNAGYFNQAANSIVLNATGSQLNNTTASSLVVKPIRNASGTHQLEYDPTTGEVTYDTLATGDFTFNGSTIISPSNADITLDPSGTGGIVAQAPMTFNAGYIEKINTLTSSSTITVNCATASIHKVTLATATEFNIANLPTGGTVTLIITQDGTGSRTATFGTDGSSAVKFPGGTSTLSTGAGDIDVVTIVNDGTNFLGNIAKDYS